MIERISAKTLSTAALFLLALTFVFSQAAWALDSQNTGAKKDTASNGGAQAAPQKQSVPSAAKPETAEEQTPVTEAKPSRGGRHEGIQVHGHWTIEVRNPDGTVVTHREFENALVASSGGPFLANFLNSNGSNVTPFLWAVSLDGPPSCTLRANAPPSCVYLTPPCGDHNCVITVPGVPSISFASDSQNLTTAAPASGSPNAGSFVMNGSVVATASTSIAEVDTLLLTAAPPSFTLNSSQFTSATAGPNNPGFTTPVAVAAGQTIAVTVIISFS
jgi:hypothetical protein